MKNVLLIYAHPDETSFNHAVAQRVKQTVTAQGHRCTVLDLYKLGYNPVMTATELKGQPTAETKAYQAAVKAATDIVFVFPVWWFRAPAVLEGFLDKTFTPRFAYRFKPLIGRLALPVPLLRDKKVTAFLTHGAPSLPVRTLYVNAVKYRFLLGFLSFCFNVFRCMIVQLWSVPFVDEARRKKYLRKVERITVQRLRPAVGQATTGLVEEATLARPSAL